MVKISVIVCTHNRSAYLQKAVLSLMKQSLPMKDYEIIVVDNASTDNTKESVDNSVIYMYESRLGLSHARNTGLSIALGKYVAYLDDDAIASPDWLENILKVFAKTDSGAIGGRVLPIWESARPSWLADNMLSSLSLLDSKEKMNCSNDSLLFGVNIAFQTKLLKDIGGFDTSLGRVGDKLVGDEETLVQRKLLDLGYSCLYHPDLCVYHHVSPERLNKNWFIKRSFWGGVSSAAVDVRQRNVSKIKNVYYGVRELGKFIISLRTMSFCNTQ